jgi:SAM-dependent methyltransferase
MNIEPAMAATEYEQLPYPSMPYAHTQPARLAAVTAVYGLAAPAPERARVLELGCAAGGNLIPLAARFPAAHFVGVDLAERHIEAAQRRIAALGLGNIEARRGDLALLSFAGESFDYVICHGVFSWVPEAVQDAIFRICRDALTANGVAAISYNVLPGWRMRAAVRDLCMRHVRAEEAPMQRVTKVRALLNDIAAGADANEPYGLLIRQEARRIAHRPASYIMAEFLAPHNSPCHFQDFAARAGSFGLHYVAEADLDTAVPQSLTAEFQARLRMHAGGAPTALEQGIDDFTGRTFRCSVLAKTAPATGSPDWTSLAALHVCGDIHRDPSAQTPAFKDGRGRAIRTDEPLLLHALARLADARPETLAFGQLCDAGAAADDATRVQLGAALGRLARVGQIELLATPRRIGRASEPLPQVWPLARLEAGARQPWLTSLTHAPVAVKPAAAVLIPYLDGRHDRQQLRARFVAALRNGEVRAPETEADANLEKIAADYVERVLKHLAENALLVPAPAG